MTLWLAVSGTDYRNRYRLWVYPDSVDIDKLKKGLIISREFDDATAARLEAGDDVLLMPGESDLTVGALFQTDYWNYRMFKTISEKNGKHVSPGTLGILTDPSHPLFAAFPTDMHTDWQWFPVIKNSHPFILDNTGKGYRPIVQVIDNIERNHKLGLVFEFAVGKGRLLIVMSDLEKASEYPEGRQFYASVLEYMKSDKFRPATQISSGDFRLLLNTKVEEGKIGELYNITPY